jgi:predicted O-methyltransferase YrrM
MFCCGDALNPTPASEKAAGVRRFLDLAAERDDYVRVLLPIYDGVMLMHRRPAGR